MGRHIVPGSILSRQFCQKAAVIPEFRQCGKHKTHQQDIDTDTHHTANSRSSPHPRKTGVEYRNGYPDQHGPADAQPRQYNLHNAGHSLQLDGNVQEAIDNPCIGIQPGRFPSKFQLQIFRHRFTGEIFPEQFGKKRQKDKIKTARNGIPGT